jgi:hypothetical protein
MNIYAYMLTFHCFVTFILLVSNLKEKINKEGIWIAFCRLLQNAFAGKFHFTAERFKKLLISNSDVRHE